MAPTYGRLEGQITVTGTVTATVGGGTATITPGLYYPSTLLTEVATQFATASGTTATVSAGLGENGTGLVTIAFGVAKAITWVTTSLRDILGYTGNLASGTSHVATTHIRNVWLPNCAYNSSNDVGATYRGWREADVRSVENAAGYVWTHMGQEKEVNWLRWSHVARSKTFQAHETTTNASFERFCRDAIWGVASWGTPGGPVRFYPNAASSTYATYQVGGFKDFKPTQYHDGWAGGPWTIELPRLVVVPGT